MDLTERVSECIALVPLGRVVTIKELANMCGKYRLFRSIRKTLKNVVGQANLPWHRVVENNGCLLKGVEARIRREQKSLLINEGIDFKEKVDLSKYAFYFW